MVKKILVLLVVGMLAASSPLAKAQELLVPTPSEDLDLPPKLEIAVPDVEGSAAQQETLQAPVPDHDEPSLEPIPSGDLQAPLKLFERGSDRRILDCEPALLESTGTWLRRGFWSSEVDITFMDRIWRQESLNLMAQGSNAIANGLGSTLTVDGGISGAEASPRLKVSRFFFRDHLNRDHTAEMVFYGGGQWSQEARLDATAGSTLAVLNAIGRGFPSFDGATSTQFSYDNRFNSIEMNYHVKSRMLRDRMELEPSGHWVRRAQPSNTRSLLAGIRYFDVDENFAWDAFGIADTDADMITETGNYRVRSDNDMIGTQFGFSFTHERARWSLGLQSKGGIFWNHTNVVSNFAVTGGGTSGSSVTEVDNLSFITEGSIIGKWHLRPNFSLRAGLEILYVSSIAHAVEQVNFIPVSTDQSVATGDSTYMGGSFGFEGYW
ncbi:MAG: BBP7 family outer membrane beta-barrel protein [Pirellulales bacterium]|nr:BBP7 family outer membrane beta-barrel protein [Pirellulales bacterium]